MTSPYNERDLSAARDHDRDQHDVGADTGEFGSIENQNARGTTFGDDSRFAAAAHEAGRMGQSAADTARRAAEQAKTATKRVQRGITEGANWVKQRDAGEMWGEVQELARKHPGKSMLAVAALGFMVGRGVRRSR